MILHYAIITVLVLITIFLIYKNQKLQKEKRIGLLYRTDYKNVNLIADELNKLIDMSRTVPCNTAYAALQTIEEARVMFNQVGSTMKCSDLDAYLTSYRDQLVTASLSAEGAVGYLKGVLIPSSKEESIVLIDQFIRVLKTVLYSACNEQGMIDFDKAKKLFIEIHQAFCFRRRSN